MTSLNLDTVPGRRTFELPSPPAGHAPPPPPLGGEVGEEGEAWSMEEGEEEEAGEPRDWSEAAQLLNWV